MNEQQKNQSEEVFRDVASSITSLRQYRRMSIEDAAEQIGMPVKKLEAIERGTFFNNTPALCRIVEALGGRLAIIPTDNPGVVHIEFIPPQSKIRGTPTIKKAATRFVFHPVAAFHFRAV